MASRGDVANLLRHPPARKWISRWAFFGPAHRSITLERHDFSSNKKFYTHDGKAHFNVTEWRPSGDPIDENFLSS